MDPVKSNGKQNKTKVSDTSYDCDAPAPSCQLPGLVCLTSKEASLGSSRALLDMVEVLSVCSRVAHDLHSDLSRTPDAQPSPSPRALAAFNSVQPLLKSPISARKLNTRLVGYNSYRWHATWGVRWEEMGRDW